MKTIMIDMDEVITTDNFTKMINDYLGYIPDYDSFEGYYLQDILQDKKMDFFDKFKDQNLYEEAKLLPNCYEVMKKLNEKYKIYICSTYIFKEIKEHAGISLNNKYNFLYKKLGFINPDNYIFAGDKSIINCDIKIDDKIENLKGAKVKLLFTAYHNKNYSEEYLKKENIIRVDNWNNIKKILIDKE